MLTTKMLLGVTLLMLVIAYTKGEEDCPEDYCNDIKCKRTDKCKGSVVEGKCGCCKECAKTKGQTCNGFDGGICDEGLVCEAGEVFSTCQKPKK